MLNPGESVQYLLPHLIFYIKKNIHLNWSPKVTIVPDRWPLYTMTTPYKYNKWKKPYCQNIHTHFIYHPLVTLVKSCLLPVYSFYCITIRTHSYMYLLPVIWTLYITTARQRMINMHALSPQGYLCGKCGKTVHKGCLSSSDRCVVQPMVSNKCSFDDSPANLYSPSLLMIPTKLYPSFSVVDFPTKLNPLYWWLYWW